jgi:metal-responsive CopG/Arc/MetJ family transcriptional regulator
MSTRMSVVLPDDLAQTVKILSHQYKSQSDFVETALRRFIRQIRREEQQQRDLEIINRHADELNAETQDALRYQIPV